MIHKPLRVLHVIADFHPTFSGRGEFLKKLLPLVEKEGFEFAVLAHDKDGAGPTGQFDNIRIHRIQDHRNDSRNLRAVCLALVGLRDTYDVIHLNGGVDHIGILPILAHLMGKKIVQQMVLAGADDPMTFLRVYRFARTRLRLLARMDGFAANSKALCRLYLQAGMPEYKLHHIPNGTDLRRFLPVSDEQRRVVCDELGLDRNRKRVIFVGAIVQRKGVDFLLDAWEIVQARRSAVDMILLGLDTFGDSHENEVKLNEYAIRMKQKVLNQSLRVHFLGLRPDVERFLQASDIFAFPSQAEGFPNVLLEAMACGLPCVVTPIDGIASETIEDGRNGFIVEHPAQMAERIVRLLDAPELCAGMGAAGVRVAQESFDIAGIAVRYAQMYRSIHQVRT